MADYITDQLCEWNSAEDRRSERGDKLHPAGARFVVNHDDGNKLRLCLDCAKLPRFEDLPQYEIVSQSTSG